MADSSEVTPLLRSTRLSSVREDEFGLTGGERTFSTNNDPHGENEFGSSDENENTDVPLSFSPKRQRTISVMTVASMVSGLWIRMYRYILTAKPQVFRVISHTKESSPL